MVGRIFFPGNPWPEGHAIDQFELLGLLDRSGVRLLLHLRSAAYNAEREIERDEDDEPDSAWDAPAVWTNYGSCILSATHWGIEPGSGFAAVDPGRRFSVTDLAGRAFRVDPEDGDTLSHADETHVFRLYLLGHDTAMDHRIVFSKTANGLFDIDWSGRIALTYVGSRTLGHTFRAALRDVPFSGIVAPSFTAEEAMRALAEDVSDATTFTLLPRSGYRNWFAYVGGV
jgi:hypothetical protein